MNITDSTGSLKKIIQRKSPAGIWILVILILFSQMMLYTWIRTESTHARLRISRSEALLLDRRAYQRALQVEKEWLKSDARITEIAKTRLNMSAATLNHIIYLPEADE